MAIGSDKEIQNVANDARWDAVLAKAGKALEEHHIPAVAIGVLMEGETRTGGLGVTDPRAPLAVDGDTLFQIGSISKTFTAALVLLLQQRGLLDLDAPLRTYLPDFRVADEEASAKVTPRLLFSHTAGWLGDYFADDVPGLQHAVERMRWLPQVYPVGTLWSYNNASYYAAGRLVEVLSGRPFPQAAKEMLFTPLGMKDSAYRIEDVLTPKVAMGFCAVYEEGQELKPGRWYGQGAISAGGGISATVRDMLRWARFTIDGRDDAGNELLSPASRALLSELRYANGPDTFVGFTWFTRDAAGTRLMSHAGNMLFQTANLLIAPARGFAIVNLTNSERGYELIEKVSNEALRAYLGIVEPETEPLPGSIAALTPYTGHYTAAIADVDVALDGDTLWLKPVRKRVGASEQVSPPTPPSRLALTAQPDVLLALDPPFTGGKVQFLRDDDGAIAWLRSGARLYRKES